eukprot:CAMPEP_0174846446 /NCGR_PEP_ID=MMETSP1114-20130205/12313_1 /TAXON_ID=312471 /ORGANISM="Neobodo designis, Strain CCAP 1951/1" /LENGTH=215 /DNA_ID=CAMNT_0016080709 /DNA_START=33 /DNA_END=677 /DNA_ORIENTATION=-
MGSQTTAIAVVLAVCVAVTGLNLLALRNSATRPAAVAASTPLATKLFDDATRPSGNVPERENVPPPTHGFVGRPPQPTADVPNVGHFRFNLTAVFDTDHGRLVWGLHDGAAPATVRNFVQLIESGFYNHSCIYRYEKGFVLQGGGCKGRSSPKTVPLEYNLPNVKNAVALARSSNPHSGGSEWFINLRDNTQGLGPQRKGGYAVFAHVLDGFDTI